MVKYGLEIKNGQGVPPGIAPTMPGKGWYHDYHTIQNESAIHNVIISEVYSIYNRKIALWRMSFILKYITRCEVWMHTCTSFLVSHRYCGKQCLGGRPECKSCGLLSVTQFYFVIKYHMDKGSGVGKCKKKMNSALS